MFDFYKNWMEFFFFALMVIGIAVSLLATSAIISYIIIILSGMFAGRIIHQRMNRMKFPYFIIIMGFVIGYLLGAYYGSRLIIMLLFVIGAIASYRLYDKKILKDVLFIISLLLIVSCTVKNIEIKTSDAEKIGLNSTHIRTTDIRTADTDINNKKKNLQLKLMIMDFIQPRFRQRLVMM